jgi:hypothetical protein
MTDHLSTDERRQMVRNSLKQLAQQKFGAEVTLVINRGAPARDLEPVQRELRMARQGIANLEAEYAELLAEPEQVAAPTKLAEDPTEREPAAASANGRVVLAPAEAGE